MFCDEEPNGPEKMGFLPTSPTLFGWKQRSADRHSLLSVLLNPHCRFLVSLAGNSSPYFRRGFFAIDAFDFEVKSLRKRHEA